MKTKTLPPPKFRLVSVCVVRPKGQFRFATLGEALDSFRPWVGCGEAIRIFEKTFDL